jgi:hypothetical protein
VWNRILNKTLDYLDAFARFKQKENVEAVERLLSARKELSKFERSQIGVLEHDTLAVREDHLPPSPVPSPACHYGYEGAEESGRESMYANGVMTIRLSLL